MDRATFQACLRTMTPLANNLVRLLANRLRPIYVIMMSSQRDRHSGDPADTEAGEHGERNELPGCDNLSPRSGPSHSTWRFTRARSFCSAASRSPPAIASANSRAAVG